MAGLKRRIADAVGDAVGLHIIQKSGGGLWPEEQFARNLFASLAPDCIFDVGANIGQYGQSLRKAGFRGTILSFEPAPDVFAQLQQTTSGDPHWHVYNYALGTEEAVLPFNVMKWSSFSSFRAPTAVDELAFSDVNVVERVIDVPVKTLADCYAALAAEHRFSRPFLKMDTQGFDLQVVRGAGDAIGRFVGMMSEVAMRRLYEDSPGLIESLETFFDAGFDLVGMYPVHPDTILNPLEFNCYVVRRDLAK